MQPNNINTEMPTTPMNPGDNLVFRDKPKKNTGMIVGMVILAVLAAGGIGFGVWAYLSGNQKNTELNNKISDLNSQITTLNDEINNAANDSVSLEIGDCTYTAATEGSGATVQCAALLNEDAGTITYDSTSNMMQFMYNTVDETEDEIDVNVDTEGTGEQEVVEEVDETITE